MDFAFDAVLFSIREAEVELDLHPRTKAFELEDVEGRNCGYVSRNKRYNFQSAGEDANSEFAFAFLSPRAEIKVELTVLRFEVGVCGC